MSTPQPGPARRRRIAGERRSARPLVEPTAGAPSEEPSSTSPVAERSPRSVAVEEGAPPPGDVTTTEKAPKPKSLRRPRTTAQPATERSGGWWGSKGSLLVLTGLLVVLLVVAALLAFGLLGNDSIQDVQRDEKVEQASRSASATAERAAAAVLAYDYRSLESGEDNATKFLTDDFAKEYTSTFEKVVAPAARQTKAKVTADVQASAVVRASEDKVRVLLFIDQTTESTANPTAQLALNRVEMVMVREDGSWLVDEITSY